MNKDKYLIIEVDTGNMDGFYGDENIATEVLGRWKERRPEHHLVLVKVLSHMYIPEDKLLADAVYGIVREV